MGKQITPQIAATFMLLFLNINAHAQTHNDNLHRTVTHRQNGSAKVDVSKAKTTMADPTLNLSQENTMPQNNGKFGYWTAGVNVFDNYITKRLPELDKDGLSHGIYLPHGYNYKNWTKEDWTNLATTYNGVEMFNLVANLKTAAAQQPDANLTADDIQNARNALDYLKPNNCESWKAFGKMIDGVDRKTRDIRDKITAEKKQKTGKSGALLDLDQFGDIAGDPMDVLDQQKALDQLDKNEVKMDSEHTLKSPDPKAIALDAVKAIKGAVRAA